MQQATAPNRSQEVILAEAADIMRRFKEQGQHSRKDPLAIARLVSLREESGLPVSVFCPKVKCSEGVYYMWAAGSNSSGKDWPALQAALAMRKGNALAASINAEVEAHKPPAPATKSQPELLWAAGSDIAAQLGAASKIEPPAPTVEQTFDTMFAETHESAANTVAEPATTPKRRGRPPGSTSKKAAPASPAANDTRPIGDVRIVEIAEGSIIVLERVKVVREEVHPGTPEHTAILRDLYKRALG